MRYIASQAASPCQQVYYGVLPNHIACHARYSHSALSPSISALYHCNTSVCGVHVWYCKCEPNMVTIQYEAVVWVDLRCEHNWIRQS